MTHPLREGQLIAYVGDDDPEHDLFNGQPGVVIDVGPTACDISVALASGPAISIPAAELALIDVDQYRLRSARMRAHEHPIRDEVITPLHIEDPLESEHD